MDNKGIRKALRLTQSLMELHGANAFKARAFGSAAEKLRGLPQEVSEMPQQALEQFEGLGKNMAAHIRQLAEEDGFPELNNLLEKTPPGVIEMLDISGIGPKKIATIWQELGVTSLEALEEACQNHQVAALKGFGQKTEANILDWLEFRKANRGKLLFAEAQALWESLSPKLEEAGLFERMSPVGELARSSAVVSEVAWVAKATDFLAAHRALNELEPCQPQAERSGPYIWRGTWSATNTPLTCYLCPPEEFDRQVFLKSSAPAHLARPLHDGSTLYQKATANGFPGEEALYREAGLPPIPPELREGLFEWKLSEGGELPKLLRNEELKGILHNHSTYSDGLNSLREMAEACRSGGYQYLGISDHSQSAFYANGLKEQQVAEQQAEIAELNREMAPFKILSGIESDILGDGSLDYPEAVLKTFDFIVASVHSGLQMDAQKATTRLIKAVENPYTRILGHPTGRLLLLREGYPLDHRKVIDACAANGVAIEINANPRRLDIDWRWLPYALEKEVLIAICPDAHEVGGYQLLEYGVRVGRKGGLTAAQTLNAWPLEDVENWLKKR